MFKDALEFEVFQTLSAGNITVRAGRHRGYIKRDPSRPARKTYWISSQRLKATACEKPSDVDVTAFIGSDIFIV